MAKPKGLFSFSGTLHNVTGVQSREGFHIRAKQQIPKEKYATEPQYAAFRENGQLMKTGAKWSKALRGELLPYTANASDTRMYARLNAAMRAVAKDKEQGLQKLRGFEFHKNKPLSQSFNAPLTIDKATGKCNIPVFNPATDIKPPSGTTHIQIAIITVDCDFETGSFTVSANDAGILSVKERKTAISLQTEDHFSNAPVKLSLLRISFIENLNGHNRELTALMKIIETSISAT